MEEADDHRQSSQQNQCFKMNNSLLRRAKVFTSVNSSKISLRYLVSSLLLCLLMTVQLTLASMSLPDGIENILGFVPKSTFQCERDGYFGDIDNDCRIFHLCQRQILANGRTEWRHWTYACGNQTMFNQLTLTCAFVDEAIPCRHASQFQYLNEVINKPSEPFLTDADVTSGISYYSNRVMSDGARARAFEDSTLMAQIGGQATAASVMEPTSSNQQQQQQFNNNQPSFASSAVAEERTDDRAINFIDQPIEVIRQQQPTPNQRILQQQQPRQQQQQRQQVQFQQAAQQFQPLSLPQTDPNAEVIINHQHNFEHTPNNQQFATVQQFNQQQFVQHQPVQRQQSFLQPLQSRAQAQQSAETINRQVFAAANGADGQPEVNQRANGQTVTLATTTTTASNSAASQVQPIDNTPKSFEFSISTNHRQGSGDSSDQPLPAFVFTSRNQAAQFAPIETQPATTIAQQPQQQNQHQQNQQQVQFSQPPPQFAPFNGQVIPPPPPAPQPATTVPTTTVSVAPITTTTTANSPPNFGTSVTTTPLAISETPTTARIATSSVSINELSSSPVANPTTFTSNQRLAPVTSSVVTQTNNNVNQATPIVATTRSLRQPTTSTRTSNQTRQSRLLNMQNDMAFDRFHSSFQSTRLSSQTKPKESRSKRSDSALVLRKEPKASLESVAKPEAKHHASALFNDDFWRKPFEWGFLAPKFEQLLTRRRV